MTVTCPKGHTSTEDDFCSECGVKIANAAAPNGANSDIGGLEPPPLTSGANCPDCMTPRPAAAATFCELCGYNFETGAHGEIPLPPIAAEAEPVSAPAKWTVHVAIDPALKEPGSPEPPMEWQRLTIPADGNTLLIGRRSAARNIAPEISLDFDTAVSHRHAILTRTDSNGWTLRDIGSSNGTRLNGQDVQPMTDVLIKPGDRITLGHWTCLTLVSEAAS